MNRGIHLIRYSLGQGSILFLIMLYWIMYLYMYLIFVFVVVCIIEIYFILLVHPNPNLTLNRQCYLNFYSLIIYFFKFLNLFNINFFSYLYNLLTFPFKQFFIIYLVVMFFSPLYYHFLVLRLINRQYQTFNRFFI